MHLVITLHESGSGIIVWILCVVRPPTAASERHFQSGAAAGNLPQVESLLSLFIMTIKNYHNSLGFIKINDPAAETHLLTYSSLHELAVNSQLPVSATGVWQQNLSPLSDLSQDLQHKAHFLKFAVSPFLFHRS